MNNVIRYVVKMKNGDYMRQEFDDMVLGRVKVFTVDNPIDADLLKSKEVAERCVWDIVFGNTNLLVLYNDENPPVEVEELVIGFDIKK